MILNHPFSFRAEEQIALRLATFASSVRLIHSSAFILVWKSKR